MINVEVNRATNPASLVPTDAAWEFVGHLPLVRNVLSADSSWPGQLQLAVNSHIADFLQQLKSAHAMNGVGDEQSVSPHAGLTVTDTQLCRRNRQTPANAFDALQFRGTVYGLDAETAELLLLLGTFVCRDNITGRTAPNLLHFQQRLPILTKPPGDDGAASESSAQFQGSAGLPELSQVFPPVEAIVAPSALSERMVAARYVSVVLYQRGTHMDHENFQSMVADVNSRLQLGDSLWPQSGSLLIPYEHAWEIFGWCTSDPSRLDYCTAVQFDLDSRDVWLSHMRLRAEKVDGEANGSLPPPPTLH